MKELIEKILPKSIYTFLKRKKRFHTLRKSYSHDLKHYSKYSALFGFDSKEKLIGQIIREYHILEKGLTMPETRLGFGKDVLLRLSKDCIQYINMYGANDSQLTHAIDVVLEYEVFHKRNSFQLDPKISEAIDNIKQHSGHTPGCEQKTITQEEFFKNVESPFPEFSKSRASVRNYANVDLPIERIENSLEIARTTPSACNRQCYRSYVYTDKKQISEILNVQGGSRGFGHLANKLIVITSEVGVFSGIGERNEAYVDGGMYAMNLLYALHYNKIAACILNCSNNLEKDKELRKLCAIKDSEVFIAMIACGMASESFQIALSKRYNVKDTNVMM